MIALKIEDVAQFTSQLFLGQVFDRFLLREASIVTYNAFSIDGHIRKGYYTQEEMEENQVGEMSSWKAIKPICFSLIKGKKLPSSFQVVLQMAPEDMEEFLSRMGLAEKHGQVDGLLVNIRYETNLLHCVTGTSASVFTMDKSLDEAWDESVKRFLKKNQICFTQV